MKTDRRKFCEQFPGALYKVLEGDNSLSRCHAVRALARIGAGDARASECLIDLLLDPDPDIRVEVVDALGRLKIADAVEPIFRNIEGDPDGDVRIRAVSAISEIRSPKAVESLIRCIEQEGYPELDLIVNDMEYSACWEVQSHALDALGQIGDGRAADAVIRVLENEEFEDLQESGFQVLAKLDSVKSKRFLLGQLADGSRLARRRAARALAMLPESSPGAHEFSEDILTGLTSALLDKDAQVRIAVAHALGETKNPFVATSLTMLLTDPDAQVRREVATILGTIRRGDIVERLHGLLAEPDMDVKYGVVQVLGEIGDPASFDVLSPLLESPDEELRYEVICALGKIGRPGAEDALAAILEDSENHYTLRARAASSLGQMLKNAPADEEHSEATGNAEGETGPDEQAPTPETILRKAAFDDNSQVAFMALSALIEADPGNAAAILSDLLDGGDGSARHDADLKPEHAFIPENMETVVVGAEETPAVVKELIGKDPASSTLAAMLVGRAETDADETGKSDETGDEGSVDQTPPEKIGEQVRVHAAMLIGGFADPGSRAVETLIAATSDAVIDAGFRREAITALGRIGDERAIAVLLAALKADETEIRLAALDAVGGFERGDGIDEQLSELVRDPAPAVREQAIRALGRRNSVLAADTLAELLGDDDITVCKAALASVPETFQNAALGAGLFEVMFRFSGDLRMKAAAALRRAGDFSAGPELLASIGDPGREDYHWICIDALAELCGDCGDGPQSDGSETPNEDISVSRTLDPELQNES